MATNADNMQAALALVTAALAAGQPLPDITVDGVSIQNMKFLTDLLAYQKALIQQQQLVAGPFEVVSVAR